MPLIMTHGWPGSIFELLKVVGPLTDPTAHGGRAEDAFHLILPIWPGYGFSGKAEKDRLVPTVSHEPSTGASDTSAMCLKAAIGGRSSLRRWRQQLAELLGIQVNSRAAGSFCCDEEGAAAAKRV